MPVRSPSSSIGNTAFTVMGLSPKAAALLDQLKPSNLRSVTAVIDSFIGNNGRFFRTADDQLSRFKGELLAITDNQPASSPTPPPVTDPDTLPTADLQAAQVSPTHQIYSPISPTGKFSNSASLAMLPSTMMTVPSVTPRTPALSAHSTILVFSVSTSVQICLSLTATP